MIKLENKKLKRKLKKIKVKNKSMPQTATITFSCCARFHYFF
jgi:hypothetical protein